MKDITKFTSSLANSYADIVEKNLIDEAHKRAKGIIKYIESNYENAIKKAINHNKSSRRVEIKLPYFKRIHNVTLHNKVEEIVNAYFKELGFYVSMSKANHCSCPFDVICNRGEFKAVISW